MTPREFMDASEQEVLARWARDFLARLGCPTSVVIFAEEDPYADHVATAAPLAQGTAIITYNLPRWRLDKLPGVYARDVTVHECVHVLDHYIRLDRPPGRVSRWRRGSHDAFFHELLDLAHRRLGGVIVPWDAAERETVPPLPRPEDGSAGELRTFPEFDPEDPRPEMPPEIARRLVGHLATIWKWRDMAALAA